MLSKAKKAKKKLEKRKRRRIVKKLKREFHIAFVMQTMDKKDAKQVAKHYAHKFNELHLTIKEKIEIVTYCENHAQLSNYEIVLLHHMVNGEFS